MVRWQSSPRRFAPALALVLAACAMAPVGGPAGGLPPMPEGASGLIRKTGQTARHSMVVAAHPLAAEAGRQMLRAGGTAIDAAVAVQMVLSLVEPQSSGIGGGAFLLHWDGRAVQAWDGRETAPAAADERLFLRADGQPMPFAEAVVGGRAVGIPGAVRMLEAAHAAHGRLPWGRLFEPAIALAEQGFAVSPRLHTQLAAERALKADPQAAAYFYAADGMPWPVGHRLRNPALAVVLRAIASRGSAALHQGPVAADIVARVRDHATNPGRMAVADLAGYAPRQRTALCTDWQRWRVCGFPPPSSGHLTMMQILGQLDAVPASLQAPVALAEGVPAAPWLHLYTESARLAFADRGLYVADPEFAAAPGGDWRHLLDGAYLKQRAELIGAQSMKLAQPGRPAGDAVVRAPMAAQPESGTSHVSIVDAAGRAVALTTTIESGFGARLMSDGGSGLAGGFLLNNELTDFSFAPADAAGRPIANRVQPGKRPRSSMSPTLVFDLASGRLELVAGSPGGEAIIHFTAKSLLGTLTWGLSPQAAADLPNFGSFNGPTVLEVGRFPAATAGALRDRGHVVQEIEMTSGVHLIQRSGGGWAGGADPRREGVALAD